MAIDILTATPFAKPVKPKRAKPAPPKTPLPMKRKKC
ncbi:hypothetical protein GURKE_04490 [Brevundimonas phage vB_BpoS-Gurke]|uniref:Uncharacterized protein n=1 Tax=Brevundimonas phage vB_BpoS-Gurke TaxID=2948599 RepID=A0A9E7N241_9CAUD|nr:hypothetical protein GURKE_04490 [Brevundimonas phage vB_BpoS-Gurke]